MNKFEQFLDYLLDDENEGGWNPSLAGDGRGEAATFDEFDISREQVDRVYDAAVRAVSAEEKELAEQDMQQYRLLRQFFEMVRLGVQEAVADTAESTQSYLFQRYVPTGWRGKDVNQLPLDLKLPPIEDYDWQISLASQDTMTRPRKITGEILSDGDVPEHAIGAKVWLVAQTMQKTPTYPSATVDDLGVFEFPRVEPGTYVFEMAWADDYFELYEIEVP